MLSGMSWKANSSMEKFQNLCDPGEWLTDFLEYLLPRLFPSFFFLCQQMLDRVSKELRAPRTYPNVESLLHQDEG